jgi:transcriptional regulator with XRE-family HTH domain
MRESFGARVRQQREHRGISLRTIAEQTKIKLSLLEGLERDDISQWPAGIFRRAYVRTYALAIGLDADALVREFVDVYQPAVEIPEPPAATPTRLRSLVDSAFGSLSRLRRPTEEDAPITAPPPPEAIKTREATTTVEPPPAPVKAAESAAPVQASASPEPEPPPVVTASLPPSPDLMAAARLCTELGRVDDSSQVTPLLREAARILDAQGLIVWVWDSIAAELRPALVCGYSDKVRSQLPGVRRDADNVTAQAFRSARTCAVNGSDDASGALAVPLLTSTACAGVLAIELPHGSEEIPAVRAVATFFAAMLAQLVGAAASEAPPVSSPRAHPLEAQAG